VGFTRLRSPGMVGSPTQRAGLKDERSFAAAYAENRSRVVASALRVLKDTARAEDVAQEVFERLWRDPRRFDPRRGELGPYLQLVARSRALDAWRADGAHARAADRLQTVSAPDDFPEADRPDVAAEHDAQRTQLLTAMRCLPPAQREVILLAYWGGMSSSEIATQTGVPHGTAKSRLRLAHERLRVELAGDESAAAAAA
jgi:RNA polymerase sigma-70 factor (ECF subfamily)